MAGSPSWAPHLRGDALPPFPSLTESIDRDSVPTQREHSGWTQAAFAKWFPSNAFDEALWDTVLALWRLYYDVNKDADKDLWDKYVLAYLVSTPIVHCMMLSYHRSGHCSSVDTMSFVMVAPLSPLSGTLLPNWANIPAFQLTIFPVV